jgi:hypothetical protein
MSPERGKEDPEAVRAAQRAGQLERGRQSYEARAWIDAYEALSHADQAAPLEAEDLELLARSAYMLGRDNDYVSGLERAHHAYLDSGESSRAVRCAFWIGHNLTFRGETSPALGWFARARRLLEREEGDSVERGYLLIPAVLEHVFSGDFEGAYATATETAEIGERFGDQDLVAMALMEQGHALVKQGRKEQGLRLVDETMVAVTAGGAVADRRRHRLLQHDRVLSRRVRAAPRPRVDRRPDAVVRSAARHGGAQGPVPGASRRDHDAGWCVARRAGRSASGRRAFHPGSLE